MALENGNHRAELIITLNHVIFWHDPTLVDTVFFAKLIKRRTEATRGFKRRRTVRPTAEEGIGGEEIQCCGGGGRRKRLREVGAEVFEGRVSVERTCTSMKLTNRSG